ncbi:MAG: 23S rRNA (adenine(2503)-C(2))-methyltransferase RlmN [Thermoanaerobaculia bacterium]
MNDPCAPFAWPRSVWEDKAREMGEAPFRGRQIFDALHRRSVANFGAMSELSADARERWATAVPMALPETVRREASGDGSVKYGLRFSDGALVEAVFMPRGEEGAAVSDELADARERSAPAPGASGGVPGSSERVASERATVCLSSQTGCAVDCRFCVTGRLGAGRNLSGGEIVAQFLAVRREHPAPACSLVFMGMGEPMANLENVEAALDVFFETISPRRVTVSTSGFPDGIARIGRRQKQPNLAVSINAADDAVREKIMPITKKYPLAQVLAAMKSFPLTHRRRITAEYVLIAGVNDSPDDARHLARRLRGIPVKINVIPFNPDPRYVPEFQRPSERAVDTFVETLARERYTVTVRRSKGPDASAACGQLKGREADPRRAAGLRPR